MGEGGIIDQALKVESDAFDGRCGRERAELDDKSSSVLILVTTGQRSSMRKAHLLDLVRRGMRMGECIRSSPRLCRYHLGITELVERNISL